MIDGIFSDIRTVVLQFSEKLITVINQTNKSTKTRYWKLSVLNHYEYDAKKFKDTNSCICSIQKYGYVICLILVNTSQNIKKTIPDYTIVPVDTCSARKISLSIDG